MPLALREHKNNVEYQPHENKQHVCDHAMRKMKDKGMRVTGWPGGGQGGIETEIPMTRGSETRRQEGKSFPGQGNNQGRDADQEEGV